MTDAEMTKALELARENGWQCDGAELDRRIALVSEALLATAARLEAVELVVAAAREWYRADVLADEDTALFALIDAIKALDAMADAEGGW